MSYDAALRDFLDVHRFKVRIEPMGQELRAVLLDRHGSRVASDYGATVEGAIGAAVAKWKRKGRKP